MCSKKLHHVFCDPTTNECACEKMYPVVIGVTKGCAKGNFLVTKYVMRVKDSIDNYIATGIFSPHLSLSLFLRLLQPKNWANNAFTTRRVPLPTPTRSVSRSGTMPAANASRAFIRSSTISPRNGNFVLRVSWRLLSWRTFHKMIGSKWMEVKLACCRK